MSGLTSRTRAIALLGLMLVAGLLAGLALDRAVLRAEARPTADRRLELPHRGREREERSVFDRLDLTPEQRARVDSTLERRRRQMDAVWSRVEPDIRAIVDSTRQEIRGTLTAEQLAAYDSLLAERRRDARARRGGRRPH